MSAGLKFRGTLMVCMAGAIVGIRLLLHSSGEAHYEKHEVQFEKPDEGRRPI